MEPIPGGMTDLAMWSMLVGFAAPPVVALVNSSNWRPWTRALVTAVICVLIGGMTAYLTGDLSGRRWISAALVVATAAILSYRAYWRPSGIAPALERATSPGPRPGSSR